MDKNGVPQQPKERKVELADFKCELCGGDMVVRNGRYGTFYACINYPKCKFTKQKVVNIDVPCPKCGSKVIGKHAKEKVLFYSCERYPECDFSTWDLPLPEKCPDCGDILLYKKSRKTVYCRNKQCEYKKETVEK